MHNSWLTKLGKTFLTPRKAAWVLVIAGIAYFIYISPKTPVEFFDAAARDEVAIRAAEIEKYKMIDPVAAAGCQRLEDMASCRRQMDGIALLYDLRNNPKRVERSKSSIIGGFYSCDESTGSILRASDERYRALAQKLESCRKEIKSGGLERAAGDVRDIAAKDKVFQGAIFRTELEGLLLRQFQATLFWRNIH